MDEPVVRFTISGLPPTENKVRAMHWRARATAMKKWRDMVAVLAHGKPPMKQARVVLTRRSSQQPDYDGMVGAGKPIIDGLCAKHGCALIPDDSPDHITVEYRWEKAKRGQGEIEVEVWES